MSTTKRTYKEAVDIMVKWWSEKTFKTVLNQNNGDDSPSGGMTFLLMNKASLAAQSKTTPETIEKFEAKLTELLLGAEHLNRFYTRLDVDYSPSILLAKACEYSGALLSALPCKTFTRITEENEIEGRYQYGGDWFKL